MITAIIGPMKSGKSEELRRIANRYSYIKKKIQRIRSSIDDIDKTHGGEIKNGLKIDKLTGIDVSNYDVVLIDEGQFFPDLCSMCETWANAGKDVFVAALNANWKREPFEQVSKLLAKADKIVLLTALCACGKDACFSKRLTEETDEIVVSDNYKPVCRKCYFQ